MARSLKPVHKTDLDLNERDHQVMDQLRGRMQYAASQAETAQNVFAAGEASAFAESGVGKTEGTGESVIGQIEGGLEEAGSAVESFGEELGGLL